MWDLPDLASGQVRPRRSSAVIVNDWQLSGVFTGGSGAPYTVGYSYQGGIGNANLTGTPNYGARIVIDGRSGQGLHAAIRPGSSIPPRSPDRSRTAWASSRA